MSVSARVSDFGESEASVSEQELNDTIEAFREALRRYVKGDGEPALSFFSTRDDVTLANPLGPPLRGPAAVRTGAIEGAASFREGGPVRFEEVSSRFEEVSRYAVSDLGYLVQLERHEGRLVSGAETVIVLRVTLIFRREEDRWRIVHRHADPDHHSPTDHYDYPVVARRAARAVSSSGHAA